MLLEALLPATCLVCRGITRHKTLGVPICPGCALELRSEAPAARRDAIACFPYDGAVGHALRRLKYDGEVALRGPLAELWRAQSEAIEREPHFCTVPLHWRRRAARGFDQVAWLARVAFGRPAPGVRLRRVRPTAPQATLDRRARHHNVRDCFRADGPGIRGRTLWLLDDVVTTGATLAAAKSALLQAGAADVRCAALCGADASGDFGQSDA